VLNFKQQQSVFTIKNKLQDAAAEASLLAAYDIVMDNKKFPENEYVKWCMVDVDEAGSPKNKTYENISLCLKKEKL
jgi:hypothetical protein